jgi:talin
MVLYFEPLVAGAVGAASNMVHSKQQMVLLDQTKTVAECALQLVYATKEGGGNPKVSYFTACVFASLVLNLSDDLNVCLKFNGKT